MSAVASIITAVTGILGLVIGVVVSRRGQRETKVQEALATSVSASRNRLEETQQALDTYEILIKTLNAEAKRQGDDACQMRKDLGLEREGRSTDGMQYGLIEVRCRRQSSALASALAMLAEMPVGDTAQDIIAQARKGMTIHPHVDTVTVTKSLPE